MIVYNTLGRKREEFKTLEKGKVKMYVCGVTLYDECHLGHGRAYIVFDVIRRYLEWEGYEVLYVQNFTDIDDKIINRAKEEAKSEKEIPEKAREIVERYKESYFRDMDALNIKRADIYPSATEFIPEIIVAVEKLLKKGVAYSGNGDIYFSVDKFPSYGKLSGRKKEELMPGARVEPEEKKKDPLDFALWKSAKPYEPCWDSPWGKGRPGWHIECSVMSLKCLGETLDIHGGGEDLIFPHHENEIAQSESLTGKKFVNYWLHNGFVTVRGEKMSKSLKNFFLLRELLNQYPPQAIRFLILSTHYRNPLDFDLAHLETALRGWKRIEECILKSEEILGGGKTGKLEETKYIQEFRDVMREDFHTPQALRVIFDLVSELNRYLSRGEKSPEAFSLFNDLKTLLEVLGFALPEKLTLPPHLEKLIREREEARKRKDYQTADRIREQLLREGILLQDTPRGTVWRKK
ncbi:cysteine--tRNA ligase [Candidatus Calescamantes bacterium]|nr:cysteine--tRNA ligase [Candidatus Calescamantes bacterium]